MDKVTRNIFALILASFALVPDVGHAQARTGAPASSRPALAGGRIRGVVFDSLLMKPVAGASVTLMSNSRTTVSDDDGRFGFDNVSSGQQPVAISSPQLDSLGLGTLGAVAAVNDSATATVVITTPSLRTLWNFRCSEGNRIGSDSGIVWGTVRDAVSDSSASGGSAAFYWYDLSAAAVATLKPNVRRRVVATDASGVYFACGLPTETTVQTEGLSTNAASGRVALTIGPRKLQRLDLLVSSDMVLPDGLSRAATDSALALRTRGKASFRGTVRDEKGAVVSNADVRIVAADSGTRTNANGQYELSALPSGTQILEVRHVGVPALARMLNLRPGKNPDVDVVLAKGVTTLATSRTVAKSAARTGYEDRRERKLGYAVDTTVLNHRSEVFSVLRNFPLTQVLSKKDGTKSLTVRQMASRSKTEPQIYLDGRLSTIDEVQLVPPDHFRAIEVLPWEVVPPQYVAKFGQGVILFWTKAAKW